MIEQFPDEMGFVKKVLGLESLRKKHSQYSQRRELLKKYTVFMADDRILPMLTSCLGKDFLKAKKHPIPVDITRKNSLPFNILKSLSSTFLHLSEGTCVTVKAGYTHMSTDELVANTMAVLENGVPFIPRKWANVRAIAVKTPMSTSLPFYNKTPEELVEIARLAGIEQVWKSDGNKVEKMEIEGKNAEGSPKKRKDSKSPLLQALKKQKKGDEEAASAKISKKESKAKEGRDEKPDVSKVEATKTKTPKKVEQEVSSTKKKRKSEEGKKSKDDSPKKQKATPTDTGKKEALSLSQSLL